MKCNLLALEVQRDRLEAFVATLLENADFEPFVDQKKDDNVAARLRSGLTELLKLWLDREEELIKIDRVLRQEGQLTVFLANCPPQRGFPPEA